MLSSERNAKLKQFIITFLFDGSYAFTKIRLEGKKIIYGKLQNDRFTYGLGHDVGRKSYKAIYGSLQAINKAIEIGRAHV